MCHLMRPPVSPEWITDVRVLASGVRSTRRALGAAILLALAGCARQPDPAPHRVDTPVRLPDAASTIVVPISARLSDLAAAIDDQVPRALWSIDRVERRCVPAQHVSVFGAKLKILPDLSCRIVGRVTRGAITLGGHGDALRLDLPVHAVVSAQNIGGILRQETATGDARVHADIHLSVRPDWTPVATMKISYDWTDAPGVTLFGKRISFTDKADARLAGVIAGLERDLPRELGKVGARDKVAAAWRQGFTSIMLNQDAPPVWLRLTPQQLGFGGYRVADGRLNLTASVLARTETFVGPRPADPVPTPLPALVRRVDSPALAFQMPVLADYRQLEPVLARALGRLARKGIVIPRLGPVDARFGTVTMYATDGGRLAVGVQVRATLQSGLFGATSGEVWLTGLPYNAPNSERIEIRDLTLTGSTDSHSVNLLLALFQTPALLDTIRNALTQDFAKDYDRILGSARGAIAERRQGDFVLAATITRVDHGRVVPTGSGLFLPLQANGTAAITYRPR